MIPPIPRTVAPCLLLGALSIVTALTLEMSGFTFTALLSIGIGCTIWGLVDLTVWWEFHKDIDEEETQRLMSRSLIRVAIIAFALGILIGEVKKAQREKEEPQRKVLTSPQKPDTIPSKLEH